MPPMPTDLDIYRSAKLLIDRHGQDALIEAADWKKRICASDRANPVRDFTIFLSSLVRI